MSEQNITIILHIVTKEGFRNDFLELWQKKVSEIRQYPGCIITQVYEDPKDANKFIMIETWENYTVWQNFLQTDLVAEIIGKTSDYTTKWEIHKLYKSKI